MICLICDVRNEHDTEECPYGDGIDAVTQEPVAWDRAETDLCEKGTPGCSVHHTQPDSNCQTW